MRLIPAPTPTSQTLPDALHPPRTRRPADDRQHDVLRCHGGHDPPGLRFAVHLPDRLLPQLLRPDRAAAVPVAQRAGGTRSEEHTSELQSLMRISYAVFCLKNKKKTNI